MSNGDDERLAEDDGTGEAETPTRGRKTRANKKKARKRTAKTAVPKTSAASAVVKGTAVKGGTKRSKRASSGQTRVQLGNSEMFVSGEMANALTNKDLKRLRAVFKRVRKRARKLAAKEKAHA